ncbi:cyclic nucleotide-binding domain-containing protein 2-like [Dendronephthya gigantea]|uniref:cyclic nucleotide-binding domain-containing protein 2-like n=1 Tax=Dendronephthya gigantea TaxID=151771 RepID=UPI00106AD46A|nr:cyclic nucleotide-binding domain-containing protein 2-like [Dendronephthya gigantea]
MSQEDLVSTESERESEKEPSLQQWKRISKRVGFQKNWTKECIIKVLNDSNGEALQGKDLQKIPFNANLYKACVQSGRLSDRAKHLFTKDPDVRTDKDIVEIFRAVDKLQCFSKYSRAVKEGLAKFVYYSEFPVDRVVVQQGHPALSFYFILKGSVNVVVEEEDKGTGKMTKNIVGEILAGNSFGELALIHDTHRRASVICKEPSKFLRLDKSDFNQVRTCNNV